MREGYKIVFSGPVGAGKTTAISTLCDGAIINTDSRASDMTQDRKAYTTVALDYGVMNLEGGEKIHLYGTPGQERFDFMWEIITNGGLGLILFLDNSRPGLERDMNFFLHAFQDYLAKVPLIIGITKTDLEPFASNEKYYQILKTILENGRIKIVNEVPPILEVDPRAKNDIKKLVLSLLYLLDPGL